VSVEIADDRPDSPAAAPLVRDLLAELHARYGQPDADPDRLTAADLAPPRGAFVVAWLDAAAVGCGGLRRYADGVAELKRMYVAPPWRGRGVARAVLARLEARAAELGYRRLLLETGLRQPEAMALYASAGYEAIEPYGYYRSSPLSRCFGKSLPGDPPLSSGRSEPGG
jgi:GNAT superfamily N-acetyltransferase